MTKENRPSGTPPSATPIPGTRNKFIIVDELSFFVAYDEETSSPSFADIFKEAFDLEDEAVVQSLDEAFESGRIALGYYSPSSKEILIEFPQRPTPFATIRVRNAINSPS